HRESIAVASIAIGQPQNVGGGSDASLDCIRHFAKADQIHVRHRQPHCRNARSGNEAGAKAGFFNYMRAHAVAATCMICSRGSYPGYAQPGYGYPGYSGGPAYSGSPGYGYPGYSGQPAYPAYSGPPGYGYQSRPLYSPYSGSGYPVSGYPADRASEDWPPGADDAIEPSG